MAWYMNLFTFPAMGYGLSSFDSKAPMVMAASTTLYMNMMETLGLHNFTCSIHRIISESGISPSPQP